MNLKREFEKLKKHRRKYFPAIKYLLELHGQADQLSFPVDIRENSDILIILELLDLGYLDKNRFFVKKDFIEITGVYYRGGYPLTQAGEVVFRHSRELEKNYKKEILYGLVFLFLAAMIVIYWIK